MPSHASSLHRLSSIHAKIDDEMKLYQDMMNKAKDEKGDDDSDGSDEHDEF